MDLFSGKHVFALMKAEVRRLNDLRNEANKRFEQRFSDQEKATSTALAAVEKATANALAAVEKATASALVAAEKAVSKAEAAAEKRFEGLNELRGMVQDVLGKSMPRSESEANITSAREKLADAVKSWDMRHIELLDRVSVMDTKVTTNRLEAVTHKELDAHASTDTSFHQDISQRLSDFDKRVSIREGEVTGHKDTTATTRANIALGLAIGTGLLALLGYLALHPINVPVPNHTPAPQVIVMPAPTPAATGISHVQQ
jgi:hypothetical protein